MIPGHMTVVTLATMMTVEEVAAGVVVMMTIVVVADGTMTATEIMTVETVIVVVMVETGMMTGGTRWPSSLWMWTLSPYDLYHNFIACTALILHLLLTRK